MDEKENENSPKVGEIYLSLDLGFKDIYYVVEAVHNKDSGSMIALRGVLDEDHKMLWPLLFFEKKFVKVNETTVRILFGKKGEKNGPTTNDQKS